MLRYLLPAALVASPLAAEPPRAVTDIAPVQGLVASVMGELGSPEALVPSSASPHDHALSPSEARALQQAEVLFWIGPDLSPGLGRKIEAIAGDTRVVALGELPQTRHLAARDDVEDVDASNIVEGKRASAYRDPSSAARPPPDLDRSRFFIAWRTRVERTGALMRGRSGCAI